MNAVPDESSLNVLVDSTSRVEQPCIRHQHRDTCPRNPAPIRLGLSLQDQAPRSLQQSISFASGSDTTVISYNFSSSIANLVLTDNNSAPASGDFKIRLINASPNLGPTDVYIVTPGTALTTVSPTSAIWALA